ncbi:hypothetical protein M426DRAFT_265720 [Hypoxylon sp. CI-4A]|nr:hypothetical protein M426DRAFT_265720 [Hypoxylon sp. CI-4A]
MATPRKEFLEKVEDKENHLKRVGDALAKGLDKDLSKETLAKIKGKMNQIQTITSKVEGLIDEIKDSEFMELVNDKEEWPKGWDDIEEGYRGIEDLISLGGVSIEVREVLHIY